MTKHCTYVRTYIRTYIVLIYTSTGDGGSSVSSADKDNIIDAICGHGELTMRVYTLCVCVCVTLCMYLRVCVCVSMCAVCMCVCVMIV